MSKHNELTGSSGTKIDWELKIGHGWQIITQVLKALVEFFKDRNESHHIIIIAPTGSAAALLNGSTYHSVLNIGSDRSRNDATSQSNVCEQLNGVDYIFLDEMACHELYQISASLAKARNMTETPFGGLNMIFAGDFA